MREDRPAIDALNAGDMNADKNESNIFAQKLYISFYTSKYRVEYNTVLI